MIDIKRFGSRGLTMVGLLACFSGCGAAPNESLGFEESSTDSLGEEMSGPQDGEQEAAVEIGQTQQPLIAPIEMMTINVRIPEDGGDNSWANRLSRLRDTIKYYRGGAGPHIIGAQELRSATFTDLHNALGTHWAYWVDRGDGERIVMWVDTGRFIVEDFNYRIVTNPQRDNSCGLTDDEDDKNRAIHPIRTASRRSDESVVHRLQHALPVQEQLRAVRHVEHLLGLHLPNGSR
jgi:hypothetical protein